MERTGKKNRGHSRGTIDPYAVGMIKDRPFITSRTRLEGKVIAVLSSFREGRGLQLILPKTRCFKKYEIHELILTDEDQAGPGLEVNHVAGIAFIEFTRGGVAAEGDRVTIGNRLIGKIAGYDETHTPNHINIILKGPKRVTGHDWGIETGDRVIVQE
jgi:hypothetical protein